MKVKVFLKGSELVEGLEVRIYRNSIKGTFVKRVGDDIMLKLEGDFQHILNEEGLYGFSAQAEFEVLDPITYLKNNL
jgi:hypothetical protein